MSYNQHIRFILNNNYLESHGGVGQMVGFSLLLEKDDFGETESELKTIVRGNHKKSELYKRLVHTDPGKRMPQEADPLTEEENALIARGINEGAHWEKHWSFGKPVFPEIPETGSHWSENSINHFVLMKLHKRGLDSEPEAKKHLLILRLYLDLPGLPPTSEVVTKFRHDSALDTYKNLTEFQPIITLI